MTLYPRILFMLSPLIITGYIAFPVTSVASQTAKTASNRTSKSENPPKKTPSTSPTENSSKASAKSASKAANQTQDNDDQDNEDDTDEDSKNPTQSLFEAVNTGNLREVQDALNRGADLHATNVLGQTPLEMSIDLNRDRITFLLLSMRGYNNSPQSIVSKTDVSTVSVKDNHGYLSIKGKKQHNNTVATSNKISPYSHGNSGTPKPEIGFLGFQKS